MASRWGLVLGAAAAAVLATAFPAAAAGSPDVTSVTVDSDHNIDSGSVDLTGIGSAPTSLLALIPQGGGRTDHAYCVQTGITEGAEGTRMTRQPWPAYPDPGARFNTDRGKINWIVHHSYPTVGLVALPTSTPLSAAEAVAATQAAIWHFSDGTTLDPTPGNNDTHVEAFYDYLLANARDLPEPPADGPRAGQLYLGADEDTPIQALMLAQVGGPTPPVPATHAVSDGLSPTGVDVFAPAVLSAVLIVAGGGFLLVQRRRKGA